MTTMNLVLYFGGAAPGFLGLEDFARADDLMIPGFPGTVVFLVGFTIYARRLARKERVPK